MEHTIYSPQERLDDNLQVICNNWGEMEPHNRLRVAQDLAADAARLYNPDWSHPKQWQDRSRGGPR